MRDRDFCKRLAELRVKRGLSQGQLGARADMPLNLIWYYEKGDRQPGLQSIKALCRALECTATELLGI